jgi:hypothetical protein
VRKFAHSIGERAAHPLGETVKIALEAVFFNPPQTAQGQSIVEGVDPIHGLDASLALEILIHLLDGESIGHGVFFDRSV